MTDRLFAIYLGGRAPRCNTELHANAFVVDESAAEVKRRAKRDLLRDTQALHTDDLCEVDDCLASLATMRHERTSLFPST